MRQLKQKLNSRSGVTIVFALVAFLIASIASVTIVNVALNNISRVDEQQQEQREYLAAVSAASLLRGKLAGQTVAITQILEPHGAERSRTVDGSDELAEALAVTMLDRGAFHDTLTLNVGEEESMDMTVGVSYTGARVEMALAPASGGDTVPVTLVFDGARAEQVSLLPNYRYNSETKAFEIESYTKTTRVFFDKDLVYALAE